LGYAYLKQLASLTDVCDGVPSTAGLTIMKQQHNSFRSRSCSCVCIRIQLPRKWVS